MQALRNHRSNGALSSAAAATAKSLFERAIRPVVADGVRSLESLESRQLLTLMIDYHLDEPGEEFFIFDSAAAIEQDGAQDGTVGTATRIPGRVGSGALSFDGSQTADVHPAVADYLGAQGSLAFWIRTTQVGTNSPTTAPAVTGTDQANSDADGIWGWIDDTGRIALTINGAVTAPAVNTIRSTNPINTGTWQHVVMTHDSTSGAIKLYVNGILQQTATGPIGDKNNVFREIGGSRIGTTINHLTGALDEVRVYNHILDDAEAAALFNPGNTVPSAPTGLAATQTGARGVVLTWASTADNESGFRILQSTDGVNFTAAGTAGSDTNTFTAKGLTPSTPYSFRVVAFNPTGDSAPSNTVNVTTAPDAPDDDGTGLTGLYFDDGGVRQPVPNDGLVDPASNFRGEVVVRHDPTVNFAWGTAAPHPEIGPDNFSTRWLGSIRPQFTENYTFYIETDDGGWLYIDLNNDGDFDEPNELLIADPTYHGQGAANERSSAALVPGGVALTAGQNYNIKFEQFEGTGGAGAILRWESLSAGKEVIPTTQLFPVTNAAAPTGAATLTATANGPDSVTLTWTDPAVTGALGYLLERRVVGGTGYVQIAQIGDADSYTDTTALPGQQYNYRIRPFNLAGNGAYSNEASATTPPRVVLIQYNLDEGAGTTTTNSAPGGGFPGTLMNGATWVAGNTGGTDDAVQFAGTTSDQHIQTDELTPILGGTATLTSWIKTTATGHNTHWQAPGITGVEQAGAANDIFWGWIDASGFIGFQVGNGAPVKSPTAINDGQWHHIAMTRNSTTGQIQLFVDGVLAGTATHATGAITSSFNSFGVISRVNQDLSVVDKTALPDTVWLNGALDDIRVYDSVLTAGEIRQMIPLVAPTGVTAVGGDAAVQVSWDALGSAESYNVKRSATAGGPYTTVATGVTGTSYVDDDGLTNGTTYYYVVSAANALAEGPNSAEVSATPQSALPAAPVVTAQPQRTEVVLSWEAVPFATSYNVKRSATAGGPYVQVGTTAETSFADADVSEGATYYYVVSAVNTTGEGPNSAEVAATTLAVPAPWLNQDIGTAGNPALAGEAGFNAATGTWQISGSGSDIWNPEDHFHYLYQPVTGDFSIRAHVIDMTGGPILGGTTTDPWSKAGVMIREDLTAGSKHATNATTPGNQVHFQGRLVTGDTANSFNEAVAAGSQNFNGWVRLDRVGNVVTSYWSPTGADGSWVTNGTRTYDAGLAPTLYAGLAITSHDNTELSTALIDNVRIIPLSVAPSDAPTNVVATAVPGNRAVITWMDSNDTETGFRLDRSTDGGATWQPVGGDLPNSSTTYIDTGLVTGEDYIYRVRAFNTFGETTNTTSGAATIAGVGTAAPAPWTGVDIGTTGDPAFPGVSAFLPSEESFEVGGSGSDVWNPDDHFHYLYQTLTGDGSITAQVLDVQNTDAWAKAGVMIRGELTAGSLHAFNAVTAANQVHFQGRAVTGDTAGSFDNPAPAGSQNRTGWVRLVRAGNVVTAFWSPTGEAGSWVQNGTQTYASLPETVFIGLAVTSHDNTELSTSFFDNVVVEAGGPAGINLVGTAAADTWTLKRSGDQIQVFNGATATGTPVSSHPLDSDFILSGGDGDDTVNVDMSGGDISLGSFTINGGGGTDRVRLTNGDGRLLTLGGVPTLEGQILDLGTGDLKITGTTVAAVDALLASARNGATRWQGPGIGTSSATNVTGLAPVQQGEDVLVKYSYNGDANGDGRINADDYFRIDQGFLAQPANPTYFQGDFNFDDTVNADDYFLIDQAFLGQGAQLGSSGVEPVAAVTSSTSTAVVASTEDDEKKTTRRRDSGESLFGSRRIEKRAVRRGR